MVGEVCELLDSFGFLISFGLRLFGDVRFRPFTPFAPCLDIFVFGGEDTVTDFGSNRLISVYRGWFVVVGVTTVAVCSVCDDLFLRIRGSRESMKSLDDFGFVVSGACVRRLNAPL